MYPLSRRALLKGAALGGAALAAGPALIAAASRPARAADGPLALYNGQHRPPVEALIAAFTASTGIEVAVRHGSSAQLASQLMEEGAHSPADVFWSEESPSLFALAEKGLLAPLAAGTLAAVPAEYSAKDGTWIGATARCRVVVYNKANVDPATLPASVLDFASEAYADRVAFAPASGAFQQQIMAVMILKGREAALAWLKGLRQYGRVYNSDSAAVEAVESGDIPIALSNNYYWQALAREIGEADVQSAIYNIGHGDPGTLITVSGGGVLKSAKNAEAAQRFVAFMVSEEGQKAIVAAIAEYPLRPGVTSPFPLTPFGELDPAPVTPNELGDAEAALALLREAELA
ncbi:extracellular solute-binding protein [Kaistia geumhonensis]|uniref:Iron(III) transport system substrate-binding protein n=1 Tax=Kaistia geumhonensis TaxID=410839 RepID=A0ABU0M7J9_9HYPH|nr:extracellular solute-binding protein [Kaistia geumhonensis]MCX5477838.1 extracellular solute-binding protein [Kaistia geumhonensis]MDQ0516950.1 iron(III) transport system substrate-binding protein [Kaistia geumhonensis]